MERRGADWTAGGPIGEVGNPKAKGLFSIILGGKKELRRRKVRGLIRRSGQEVVTEWRDLEDRVGNSVAKSAGPYKKQMTRGNGNHERRYMIVKKKGRNVEKKE